jgi:mannose-1-phosphate guanylyltransferase/phosphomannomutase
MIIFPPLYAIPRIIQYQAVKSQDLIDSFRLFCYRKKNDNAKEIRMKAMILAAGYGKRLLPLTRVLPKPLFPVAGIPCIEYALHLAGSCGIKETVINTYHKKEELVHALDSCSGSDMQVCFSHEETLLGIAGGMKKAEALLKDGTFVVINSDTIIDIDLEKAIKFHRKKGALVTMILRRDKHAGNFGIIGIDTEMRVKRFLRERAQKKGLTETMFTGVHIFEPEIFQYIPAGRPCDISKETYPLLIKKKAPVYGFLAANYWTDIGSPGKYLRANHEILNGKYPPWREISENRGFTFHDSPKEKNGVHIIPPVIIDNSVLIKEGCRIGPSAVLGKNTGEALVFLKGRRFPDRSSPMTLFWRKKPIKTGLL